MKMISGKTSSGFEFELPETAIDNMELVDALAGLQDDNILAVSNVLGLLLSKDLRKKLYDHLRTEDGRVPASAVATEIVDILAAFNQGKN